MPTKGDALPPKSSDKAASGSVEIVDDDKKKAEEVVSWISLYQGADGLDVVALIIGVIGAATNGVVFPLFALVFGELIDALGGDDVKGEVRTVTLAFTYLGCATLVCHFLETAMFMWSGARIASKWRQRYLKAALHQDISHYDTELTSGDVVSGLNADCSAVQNAISEKVSLVIHHMTTVVAAIIMSIVRGWKLALVMIALMPLIAVAGAILAKVVTMGATKQAEAFSKANGVASQSILNIRTVQSFQAESGILERFAGMLDAPRKMAIKLSTFQGGATGFVNAVVFVTYGVAFWYAGKLVREDNSGYTGGKVMSVIFGAIIAGFSLGQAAPSFGAFATGRSAGYRLRKVIDRKPAINLEDEGIVPSGAMKGAVAIKGVSFSYPARSDVPVFTNLTLNIDAGQTVALVGPSGCGKSTVIQLLQRFYDPAAGTVSVDGNDIRKLSLRWYRDQVGLVSQEPTLFATSIKENISMGKPGATDAEIEAAASAANAVNFIKRLPEKFETKVGEKGVQLSGGQKQRIAIARALLKNPRLLLLDEATSALDTVSERLVQGALERLAEGRTSVVVAHRLSTIRNADKIAVIQAGNVVEEGSHTELWNQSDSVYHSLVALQEAATDKNDQLTAEDLQEVVKKDAELAEIAAAEAAKASKKEASKAGEAQGSAKGKDGSAFAAASSKKAVDGEKKASGGGEEEDEEELTEEEKNTKVGFMRLISLNKREWPYIALGVLASAAVGCVMPSFAIILSSLISALTPDEPSSTILRFCILFWGLGAGQFVMSTISGWCFGLVGSNLATRVRTMFFQAVLRQEIGWFDLDSNTSGALTSRLSSDAPAVRGAVADVLGVSVQNIATLVFGYTVAFTSGWKMTLVVTCALPLLGFSSYMQMKFFTGLSNGSEKLFDSANQTAYESVQALRTVQSYNLQDRVIALYNRLLTKPNRQSLVNAISSGAALGFGQGIMFWVYAFAFWYGGTLVEKGEMNLESTLKVFFSILLATMGISQAQVAFPDIAKGSKAVARVFRVVDRKSLIDASVSEGEQPTGQVDGLIELKDVSFSYPTRPDVPVFSHFSLIAPAGKVTALVGESGSGKSTIVNLVERFYDVQKGSIYLDGTDIRTLDLQWLRKKVGLVSQEPALFNGTILDNLRLGKPGATLEEVRVACEIANAVDFVEKQPDQYGTLLGEGGGISLSGGQKQRIAIARAVLKDPRVLLLDEATSALDAESERLVQGALDKLMVGRTSIVIAHRLTTVRNADKIAVVQRGVVLEEGTHDELMQRGGAGAYVQLARAQAGAH